MHTESPCWQRHDRNGQRPGVPTMFVSVHTYKETAKALQLSEDVVRKTEIRALAKLRRNKQLREAAREAGLLSEQMENAS
jgi:hypothetical protein